MARYPTPGSSKLDEEIDLELTKFSLLPNWTKEEKFYLYKTLKKHCKTGPINIAKIHKKIPTKTTEEIKSALATFEAVAKKIQENLRTKEIKGRPKTNASSEPSTSEMIERFKANLDPENIKPEIAAALRIIADCEIPEEACTETVDMRKAYHALADAMEGKEIQIDESDEFLAALITESLKDVEKKAEEYVQSGTLPDTLEY